MTTKSQTQSLQIGDLEITAEEILNDYRLAARSRQASLIGRREALSGKAKFGIFGDGKELAQIALAKFFRPGDFRSGYYRDQTLMLAIQATTIQEFFAQLFAHADLEAEPASAGRLMNAHFATRSLNPDGSWKDLTQRVNSSADVSPTGSQMPRLVGLAYASRLYRELDELKNLTQFSQNGNEVAFGAIGNATTAEGMFWEAVNAIGVLKSPAVISIWDDGYGISVPSVYQTAKEDLSELLQGFQRQPDSKEGYDLYQVRAWDYPALIETYQKATLTARKEHVPAIVHVTEVTQPQGHSTSGSHERYKTGERLTWEQVFDCNSKLREYIVGKKLATGEELDKIDQEARRYVEEARKRAWEAYQTPIKTEVSQAAALLDEAAATSSHAEELAEVKGRLMSKPTSIRQDILVAISEALFLTREENLPARQSLLQCQEEQRAHGRERYSTHLHSQSAEAAIKVPEVKPNYTADSETLRGFEILQRGFDAMLSRDPRVIAFGEDLGRLGGVNQGMAGLQEKHGELRVTDTGIRETTIIGQAIGLAMRGLRPIAEIQYLDYMLYALQILSDDLATLQWRTKGGQKAPVIVRTRGHRLEGVWHSGSYMAGILHLVRGMHVLVPRDMVRAIGFYNTLLLSDEPGLVVEVLNGYRLKERLPDNLAQMTLPLGVPEVLREGGDLTVVTYGPLCRIAAQAADRLSQAGIEIELIDVQSLLPFDIHHSIVESLKKTSRVLFLDEDVPGGTTAFMMQQVIEAQGGYYHLDSPPRTLSAQPHRPAYGTDGNYFSKPNVEDIVEAVYGMMNEVEPGKWGKFYK